ncbi:MAG: TolC family protein [Flavobacteriales bacterium]
MKKHPFICFCLIANGVLFAQQNSDNTPVNFTLKAALHYALTHSYAVREAAYKIEKAKEKKWETTSTGLPQINAAINYQNYFKEPVIPLPANLFGGEEGEFRELSTVAPHDAAASATVSQLLFDGSYLIGLQSAKTYLLISKNAAEKTEQQIRESVVNAYGNTLLVEETIQILKGNLSVLQQSFHEADAAVKNGLMEIENAEQLKINLRNMENQLRRAERQEKIAHELFNMTLGRDIELPVHLDQKMEQLAAVSMNDNILQEPFSMESHVDYRIAKNDKTARMLQLKYEKRKSLPSLSAFFSYGQNAYSGTFSFFERKQHWFGSSVLGVDLHIPIFSGLGRNARIQAAKVDLKIAENHLEQTKQQILLNLQSAKNNYRFARDQYQIMKENVTLAERVEKKERIKFFEGISTSQELNSAQRQLYQMQGAYLQSLLEVIHTRAKLESALDTPIK